MIDWPNALIGFALGLLPTGLGWLLSVRKRRADAAVEWLAVAEKIENTLWAPGLDYERLRSAYSTSQVDRWRTVLGPESFLLLEELEQAVGLLPLVAHDDAQVEAHQARVSAAIKDFANWRRTTSSEAYQRLVVLEQRRASRARLVRHPVTTIRVLRRNARAARRSRREERRSKR